MSVLGDRALNELHGYVHRDFSSHWHADLSISIGLCIQGTLLNHIFHGLAGETIDFRRIIILHTQYVIFDACNFGLAQTRTTSQARLVGVGVQAQLIARYGQSSVK